MRGGSLTAQFLKGTPSPCAFKCPPPPPPRQPAHPVALDTQPLEQLPVSLAHGVAGKGLVLQDKTRRGHGAQDAGPGLQHPRHLLGQGVEGAKGDVTPGGRGAGRHVRQVLGRCVTQEAARQADQLLCSGSHGVGGLRRWVLTAFWQRTLTCVRRQSGRVQGSRFLVGQHPANNSIRLGQGRGHCSVCMPDRCARSMTGKCTSLQRPLFRGHEQHTVQSLQAHSTQKAPKPTCETLGCV